MLLIECGVGLLFGLLNDGTGGLVPPKAGVGLFPYPPVGLLPPKAGFGAVELPPNFGGPPGGPEALLPNFRRPPGPGELPPNIGGPLGAEEFPPYFGGVPGEGELPPNFGGPLRPGGTTAPAFLPGGTIAPAFFNVGIPPANNPPPPPPIPPRPPEDFGLSRIGVLRSLVTVFFSFFPLKLLMSPRSAFLDCPSFLVTFGFLASAFDMDTGGGGGIEPAGIGGGGGIGILCQLV